MSETRSEHEDPVKGPTLVSIPEMPELLVAAGIKPVGLTRLRQLVYEPGFPAPAYVRGRVRLWDSGAVVKFFSTRVLRPGERTDLKRKREAEDSGE